MSKLPDLIAYGILITFGLFVSITVLLAWFQQTISDWLESHLDNLLFNLSPQIDPSTMDTNNDTHS